MIEEARRLGLTDEQIAPLLSGKLKQGFSSKWIKKGARTEGVLSRTKEALGEVFDHLKTREVSQAIIPEVNTRSLRLSMDRILRDVPQGFRSAIREDLAMLFEGGVSGEKIITFWQKINKLPPNQRELLGRLKGPLSDSLASVDPALAADFKITNDLFGKYAKIRKALKPGPIDLRLDTVEIIGAGMGVVTGRMDLLAEAVGSEAVRRLGAEMLINPRFQNLSAQIVKALNQSKLAIADIAYGELISEVEKVDPDIAAEMTKTNFNELFSKEKKSIRGLSEQEMVDIFGGGQ